MNQKFEYTNLIGLSIFSLSRNIYDAHENQIVEIENGQQFEIIL